MSVDRSCPIWLNRHGFALLLVLSGEFDGGDPISGRNLLGPGVLEKRGRECRTTRHQLEPLAASFQKIQ